MEITCRTCRETVLPERGIRWWLVAVLAVVLWPVALFYLASKWTPDRCPACGNNVYRRRHDQGQRR